MDNPNGQFVLTKDQAEAAVFAAAGLYTFFTQPSVTGAPGTFQITNPNPKRIWLCFANWGSTVLTIQSDADPNKVLLTLATNTTFVLKYSEVGSFVQQPFWLKFPAGGGSFSVSQVAVL